MRKDEKDLGADAAAVDAAGQAVPTPQLPHVESLRHVLDVACRQTCDLDQFADALSAVKGLESGVLLLVSRANAEAALNDARVWGQWHWGHVPRERGHQVRLR